MLTKVLHMLCYSTARIMRRYIVPYRQCWEGLDDRADKTDGLSV